MRISFTGTRAGYNERQARQLRCWLNENKNQITIAAHGCCVGADMQFHKLVREVCGNNVYIAVFPSTANTRAPIPEDADFVAEARPPLERNKDIVNLGSDKLLATPLQMHEVVRSGTWAAIRYARKRGVSVETMWRK